MEEERREAGRNEEQDGMLRKFARMLFCELALREKFGGKPYHDVAYKANSRNPPEA